MSTPEEYWILRGEDVIGTDVLKEGLLARQAASYKGIVDWIVKLGVTDVLDVGCNVAALALFLRAADYDGTYQGLDTNPFALRIARQRGESVEVGDLRHLSTCYPQFEAVVVKDVIEHLESPEPLREAFQVAKKYVIVGTYLPWTDEPASIVRHADGYYTNRYCYTDIYQLAEACGFTVAALREIDETNGQPNLLALFKREDT